MSSSVAPGSRLDRRAAFFGLLLVSAIGGSGGRAWAGPAAPCKLVNPNFDLPAGPENLPGWTEPRPIGAPSLLSDGADAPRRFLRLTPAEGEATSALFQTLPASGCRGHRVRLRAVLRTGQPGTGALLAMHERAQGRLGGAASSLDEMVTASTWETREVELSVSRGADSLVVVFESMGTGTADLDRLELIDLGEESGRAQPATPRALTERGLANLEALGTVAGLVRHFHPSDAAATADWPSALTQVLERVESATSANDLRDRIAPWLGALAPTARLWVTASGPPGSSHIQAEDSPERVTLRHWHHAGYGREKPASGYSTYRSWSEERTLERRQIPSPPRFVAGPLTLELPLDVEVSPSAPQPPATRAAAGSSLEDRTTRLAEILVLSSVLEHFYPYFDEVTTDWAEAQRAALRQAAVDADAPSYLDTLERLIANLHDGHGSVVGPGTFDATVPVFTELIEGSLVVTGDSEAVGSQLAVGDVIESIDGVAVSDRWRELEPVLSAATPGFARARAAARLLRGRSDQPARLVVRGASGATREVVLPRQTGSAPVRWERRPAVVARLAGGFDYLDLTRISEQRLRELLPGLVGSKGIVFDLRGYPSVRPTVLEHLLREPGQSARWMVARIDDPAWREAPLWDERGRWQLPATAPRITAPVAVLIDARGISYAESVLGIVEAYRLAELVGEPTAGTNGNVIRLSLGTGYTVTWTGMKVRKHDGSRHHGVGILPTIRVSKTLAGVRAGRDEQLEAALKQLRKTAG